MKTAIVHDWLVGGGAERVVEQLHELYPEAPIYTSYCTKEWLDKLDGKVVTGYLQRWPFSKLYKFAPILRQRWFEHLDLTEYDLILSTSGAEAKGVVKAPGTVHIAYIHAATHYYWSRYEDYLKHPGVGVLNPIARLALRLLIGPLRKWDKKAAQRPDHLIANSTYTQQQIKKYYGRDSTVIFPPVAVDRFSSRKSSDRRGFVIAGRQTAYKRFDLAVSACTELGLPLTVIGDGPDHTKLQSMAGETIKFITNATDETIATEFARAGAFIFPGLDDFGIVAVEAMAAGCPVIAYKAGGALDYVVEGKTGAFFSEPTTKSLTQTLARFEPRHYDSASIAAHAATFSSAEFQRAIQQFIAKHS